MKSAKEQARPWTRGTPKYAKESSQHDEQAGKLLLSRAVPRWWDILISQIESLRRPLWPYTYSHYI